MSLAAKAKGVHKHTVERRSQQVASLSEERVQVGGAVLKTGPFTLNAEAHVGGLIAYPQELHQFDKIGVVFPVENNEAGIDPVIRAIELHIDGVGVPADIVVGLENNDIVVLAKEIGGNHS